VFRHNFFTLVCIYRSTNILTFLITSGQLILLLAAQIIGSLILFTAVIAALVFTVRKPMRRYKTLDLAVFDRLQQFPNARRNRFMLAITFLGTHKFLVPANLLLIFYFLAIARQTWLSIRVLAISLSSLILMLFLKWLFGRKRPLSPLLQAARGLSFPSGHAIMSVSFFGLLIYWVLHSALPQWVVVILTILLTILVVLIGFSRIYLRVHYASDVIAGFIIGLIWLFITLAVVEKAEQQIGVARYRCTVIDHICCTETEQFLQSKKFQHLN
jgi:membrane-associated phospholipid phosphatase